MQVVLSTVGAAEGSGFSLGAFMGGDGTALRSPAREAAVAESGVPHTIVRAGACASSTLQSTPCARSVVVTQTTAHTCASQRQR